jgi:adenylate kinase
MTAEPKFIILLGPPASGKGTQATRLLDSIHLPHVASGDLFRYNLKNETALGLKAKTYMDQGALVPDDITIAMVLDRLSREDCRNGALLDGFPRTIAQAEALDAALAESNHKINLVLNISVPDEVLIQRVTGRRLCRTCGEPYHILFKKPQTEGVCDLDGGPLYQRDDDSEVTARTRLSVYWNQTSPLIDYYRGRGVLKDIDGDQSIDDVTDDLTAEIARL